MLYFDLEKPQWRDNPLVIMQQKLVYGEFQSESSLDLAIRRAMLNVEDDEVRKVVLYQRLLDNILASWRAKEVMLTAAKKI